MLAKKDAFKIKYDDDDSDSGLIGETDYLEKADFQNLKNIDKYTMVEAEDPEDEDK